jgi:hypothetical protein
MQQKNNEDIYLYLESISDMKASKIGDAASYYMDAIDSKTSSLLTHVSIMMAVLSVFYATMHQNSFVKSALLVELITYLIVTLGCLRGIFVFTPKDKQESLQKTIELRVNEVVLRLRAYKLSLYVTIITTIALIITLSCHFKLTSV